MVFYVRKKLVCDFFGWPYVGTSSVVSEGIKGFYKEKKTLMRK
jgi:hypothetical protein